MNSFDPESFGSMEEELAAYHAVGWKLDESFWPGKEPPKYHFISPTGDTFNSNHLLHGSPHACDEVSEFSSTDIINAERTARRLLILQMAYKKKYGDFYQVQRASLEDWERTRFF